MSDLEAEWARAQAAGRRKRRPLVFGVVAGVLVTVLSVAGLMFALEANLEDKTERAERGEEVREQRGSRQILGLLLVPVLLGLGAGFGVFRLTGGKIDPAYGRGLAD